MTTHVFCTEDTDLEKVECHFEVRLEKPPCPLWRARFTSPVRMQAARFAYSLCDCGPGLQARVLSRRFASGHPSRGVNANEEGDTRFSSLRRADSRARTLPGCGRLFPELPCWLPLSPCYTIHTLNWSQNPLASAFPRKKTSRLWTCLGKVSWSARLKKGLRFD